MPFVWMIVLYASGTVVVVATISIVVYVAACGVEDWIGRRVESLGEKVDKMNSKLDILHDMPKFRVDVTDQEAVAALLERVSRQSLKAEPVAASDNQ